MGDNVAARLPPEPGGGVDPAGGANGPNEPEGWTAICEGAVSCAPDNAAAYADPAYWDRRFAVEAEYEWCRDYSTFRHLVAPHLAGTARLLEVGAGNSSLAAALASEGRAGGACGGTEIAEPGLQVVATDLSPVAVAAMRERTAGTPALTYQVGDMLSLPFEDATFDVVVEKGAMDVFEATSASRMDPPFEVRRNMTQALNEAHRVLCEGGTFFSITFAQPHFRLPYLTLPRLTWSVHVDTFGGDGGLEYFVYRCRKGERGSAQPVAMLGCGLARRPDSAEAPTHEHMDGEDYLLCMDL